MDIAIGLGLAVAAQTWSAYRQRVASGEYAAYALRGGTELLSLSLHRTTVAAAAPATVNTGDFQLTWQGTAVCAPRVRLELAPRQKVRRAQRHLCSGFEFSWHRSAALVASGVLTFALAVLSGADCAQAADFAAAPEVARTVQCPVEASRAERLLANITKAARYRTFSRTRDAYKLGGSGGSGGSGDSTAHVNVVNHRGSDDVKEPVNAEQKYQVIVHFSDADPDGIKHAQKVRIEYTNFSGVAEHINTTVEDTNGKKKIDVVVQPPDDADKTTTFIVDGWDDKPWSEIPNA